MQFIYTMDYWNWLMVGLVFLMLELMIGTYYALWLGISGLIVGVLMLGIDLSWQAQWTLFASISLAISFGWWLYQHKKDKEDDQGSTLNQRAKQMVGQTVVLDQDFSVGQHRLKLGDTTWTVEILEPLQQGDKVEVIEMNGIILKIKKVI